MAGRYPEREAEVRARFLRIKSTLDERALRLFTANEALQFPYGGVAAVVRATGVAKSTIKRGIADLTDPETLGPPKGRLRRPGAGRPPLTSKDPGLVPALKELIEPATRGDPESPLLWTSLSAAKLATTLTEAGHPVSADTAARAWDAQLALMERVLSQVDAAGGAVPGFDVAVLWAFRAKAEGELGRTDDARRSLERGLSLNPRQPDLLGLKATLGLP